MPVTENPRLEGPGFQASQRYSIVLGPFALTVWQQAAFFKMTGFPKQKLAAGRFAHEISPMGCVSQLAHVASASCVTRSSATKLSSRRWVKLRNACQRDGFLK